MEWMPFILLLCNNGLNHIHFMLGYDYYLTLIMATWKLIYYLFQNYSIFWLFEWH